MEITADTENLSPETQQGELTQLLEVENTTPLNLDTITYTLTEPSSFGVTDEEDNLENVLEDEGDGAGNTVRGNYDPYNLQSEPRVQYSNATVTTIVDETDEHMLWKALKEPDCEKWLEAIRTELNGIVWKKDWKEARTLSIETKPLLPCFILNIKQNEKSEVIKHKARILVHGNFQTDVVEPAKLYALVAKINLFWLILSIAIVHK